MFEVGAQVQTGFLPVQTASVVLKVVHGRKQVAVH